MYVVKENLARTRFSFVITGDVQVTNCDDPGQKIHARNRTRLTFVLMAILYLYCICVTVTVVLLLRLYCHYHCQYHAIYLFLLLLSVSLTTMTSSARTCAVIPTLVGFRLVAVLPTATRSLSTSLSTGGAALAPRCPL